MDILQDMGLASDIATKQNSALPLGRAAQEIYERVVEEKELARKDFSSVYLYLRDRQ